MEGIDELENIAITFDEMGMTPTTLTDSKNESFMDWFGNEYKVIKEELNKYNFINRILKDGIWIECKYPQFKEPCMMKEKVGLYIRGNDIILECYNKNILLSDYKKTFWFKKDKSE